jgi:hypothetical protein
MKHTQSQNASRREPAKLARIDVLEDISTRRGSTENCEIDDIVSNSSYSSELSYRHMLGTRKGRGF